MELGSAKTDFFAKNVGEGVEYVLSDLYLVLLKIFLNTCRYIAITYHKVCSFPNYLQDSSLYFISV